MAPDALDLADYIDRPKGLAGSTTAAMYDINSGYYKTLQGD
jgi:hypothetical protein